ncbi:unnamed protein product [Protopolystoma xenopodis]|uniref:Uncharacterized protein n=1 Tax=Protopolystoma xenopodis TaxID=117903 RepID=A0A448WNY7_9PLAT|nr:unnamed protein product [Protopolystoma xenopodis]
MTNELAPKVREMSVQGSVNAYVTKVRLFSGGGVTSPVSTANCPTETWAWCSKLAPPPQRQSLSVLGTQTARDGMVDATFRLTLGNS